MPVGVVEINNLERVKLYYIFLKTMNLTVNQRVAGSSPAGGALKIKHPCEAKSQLGVIDTQFFLYRLEKIFVLTLRSPEISRDPYQCEGSTK